ncbi:MAG: carboxypeptidase-like regulatory domain-containing protein [Acidobacteriota bacterium]|nr:carboxypeptidase-like regulatory domain-containing protein [Acidobacteriota bacterium]
MPGYISARDYLARRISPEWTGGLEQLPSFVERVKILSGGTGHVEIQVKRGGSISGSVTYSDGAPVPYVALTPKVKLSDGNIADTHTGASHTDSSGHYRIDGLLDGSYIILGGIEGAIVPVFGGDQIGGSGLIIFGGDGMRPSKARVISVSGTHEYAGLDITIPLVGVHEVGGAVTASDGHRLNHGLVRLYPTGEPRFSLAAPLKADGTFSFHRIPADHYTIVVEDASDWRLDPKSDGGLHYEARTLVQRYGHASVNVSIAHSDLTNVSLVTSPIR